ncbi:metalloprotease [Mycobacterium phage Charm]|nr:metalloprotease [Mycobacterium phage Charm]
MVIHYGSGLTDAEKAEQQFMFDKLPPHIKKRLTETGTKIWVGTRADNTPGWAEFSKATGWKSTDKIADGRETGSLSFYLGSRNELFISVHHKGGSRNVYVHELSHAVDFQWTKDGKLISNDPDWIKLHNDFIKDNPNILAYYRGGPSGTDAASGRKELFAEGFTVYNHAKGDKRAALVRWVDHNEEAADAMIAIWKKYGVLK